MFAPYKLPVNSDAEAPVVDQSLTSQPRTDPNSQKHSARTKIQILRLGLVHGLDWKIEVEVEVSV